MSNIYKYDQNDKATVCAGNNCATVYGDTAKVVNTIAVVGAAVGLIALIAKALR